MKKTFQELARELLERFGKNGRVVIAVDGFGGSGKSTFAAKLCEHIPNVGVVCVDHFYQPITPDGENEFHWGRFEQEVIGRLRKNEAIRYAPYSWKDKSFGDDVSIGHDQHLIIEGVYSSQEKFRDAYGAKIWVETPEHIRLERGIGRDGEQMREMWETVWLPYTREYQNTHRPHEAADVIVDGNESDFANDTVVIRDSDGT